MFSRLKTLLNRPDRPDLEKFYERAGLEVAQRNFVPSLYTKAFSDAGGDERKAIARYIKYRVQQLEREHQAKAIKQAAAEEKLRRTEAAKARKRQNTESNSFENFCLKCRHLEEQSGVCKKIYENVREYPKKFVKKCNGKYFEGEHSI